MASELSEELLNRALALAKKKFPNQPPGFPLNDFDVDGVRLPTEIRKEIEEEVENEGQDLLADLQEETGFESVIGKANFFFSSPKVLPKLSTTCRSWDPKK